MSLDRHDLGEMGTQREICGRRRRGRRTARPRARRPRRRTLALAPQGAHPGRATSRSTAARSAIRVTTSTPARRSRSICRPPTTPQSQAEEIPLDIVYEDDEIIVINKPQGLVVHPAAGNWTGTLVNALIAHCGDSLSGIGGVRAARHRASPRQGHHRGDGGGQDRPCPPVAGQAVRRSWPGGAAAARLSRLRLGRARPAEGHDRQADRPAPAGARQDGRPRGRARGDHPLGGAGALSRAPTANRSPASSPAGWKPAGPTRSGSIWRRSAIRSWATTSTGRASRQKCNTWAPNHAPPWTALEGRHCMPIYSLWNIRLGAVNLNSGRNCRRTCSVCV